MRVRLPSAVAIGLRSGVHGVAGERTRERGRLTCTADGLFVCDQLLDSTPKSASDRCKKRSGTQCRITSEHVIFGEIGRRGRSGRYSDEQVDGEGYCYVCRCSHAEKLQPSGFL